MNLEIDSTTSLISRLLWTSEPAARGALLFVLGAGVLALLFVYLPLLVRLLRVVRLERTVRAAIRADDRPAPAHREEISAAFGESPLRWQWEKFLERWQSALTRHAASQSATSSGVAKEPERSPAKLIDVLEERPLLPTGARRSLLPALPGLFLAIGVLGTFVGLTLAITGGGLVSGTEPGRQQAVETLLGQVGLALRSSLWGLVLSIAAALAGRVLEGRFEATSEALDQWVERAYGSISAAELVHITTLNQQRGLEQLGGELTRFSSELSERIDRGLQRIERSTANAANLVSEEQRGVLRNVVRELSVQVQQGVEQHLSALHEMLERTVEHQDTVTGGLTAAFDRMAEQADTQSRVTRTLEQAAEAVSHASGSMAESAREMEPVLDHLRKAGDALHHTSKSIEATQRVVARAAEGVRGSIEHSAAAMREERDFIEVSLGEVHAMLGQLSSALGENLDHALRGVDDALAHTVGRLRETIHESNETIDRMALPVRAAEGTTRELHTALERVRSEVVGLGEWLAQAVKPLRNTLGSIEEQTGGVTRALVDVSDHARSVDKAIEALRGEIHSEGRKFRTSTSELARKLRETSDAVLTLERSTAGGTAIRLAEGGQAPLIDEIGDWTPESIDRARGGEAPAADRARENLQWETIRPDGERGVGGTNSATDSTRREEPAMAHPSPRSRNIWSLDEFPRGPGRELGPDPYSRLEAENRAPWSEAGSASEANQTERRSVEPEEGLAGLLRTSTSAPTDERRDPLAERDDPTLRTSEAEPSEDAAKSERKRSDDASSSLDANSRPRIDR